MDPTTERALELAHQHGWIADRARDVLKRCYTGTPPLAEYLVRFQYLSQEQADALMAELATLPSESPRAKAEGEGMGPQHLEAALRYCRSKDWIAAKTCSRIAKTYGGTTPLDVYLLSFGHLTIEQVGELARHLGTKATRRAAGPLEFSEGSRATEKRARDIAQQVAIPAIDGSYRRGVLKRIADGYSLVRFRTCVSVIVMTVYAESQLYLVSPRHSASRLGMAQPPYFREESLGHQSIMLDRSRLTLALDVHTRTYKLLKWIGTAIDEGRIPASRAARHSDDSTAVSEWIDSNYGVIPAEVKPERKHLREFANFFWTYITTSFEVVEQPGILISPDGGGCRCPLCARITNASHLQPKRLTRSDKRRAMNLMVDRVLALAVEHDIEITRSRAADLVSNDATRRSAGYSAYGYWLIQRLDGYTDGPAVLALWREIAWNRKGSPIQGFRLRLDDLVNAETEIIKSLRTTAA